MSNSNNASGGFAAHASNGPTKKTPLYDRHLSLGARLVEFAGWSMPVQYQGLKDEHLNVRKNVGLFDVSHMGEIRFRGPRSLESLEWLTTNSVAKLQSGQAQYSLLPNEGGGLVDDVIVYCLEANADYLVCVNAANKAKDFEWLKAHNRGAQVTDESEAWAQIAVQGPLAPELLRRVLKTPELKAFSVWSTAFAGGKAIFASTGYTGEIGGEVFIESGKATALWDALLEAGQNLQVCPVGLGARDTLRTEMKYPLYGHEIDGTTNPYEAGLGWAVKPQTKDFLGKTSMLRAREQGLRRGLVGFLMKDKGIPRSAYRLLSATGEDTGAVTSGTYSPSLDEPIGIGYVAKKDTALGTEILVEIRGRHVRAEVCQTPFVSTSLTKKAENQ